MVVGTGVTRRDVPVVHATAPPPPRKQLTGLGPPKPKSKAVAFPPAAGADSAEPSNPFGARLKPSRPGGGPPRRQLTGIGGPQEARPEGGGSNETSPMPTRPGGVPRRSLSGLGSPGSPEQGDEALQKQPSVSQFF